jgi:uncharacterized protein YhfF
LSGFRPVKTGDTDAFFRAFRTDARVEAETYSVIGFGDNPAMADEHLGLVLAGIKRATASLARDYGGDRRPLPKAGDHAVLVDGRNKPRCVLRTTEAIMRPLSAVDDDFAWDEGEGTRTRADWLTAHRASFQQQAEREGLALADDEAAVFERFTVVWPRLFADDWKGPRRSQQ